MDILELAKTVIETEEKGMTALKGELNDNFIKAVNLLMSTKGRVIVTGMGKSGHIGRKMAATFASTGTPAFFVHPSEASHGDLGMLTPQDVLVAISNSGEVKELQDIVRYAQRFNIPMIAMTRNADIEVSKKRAKATDIEELQARCDVANAKKADIFVSIHMDSFTNNAAKGTTGYYYSLGDKRSRKLADKIRAGIVDQLGTQSRGTQSSNFYVVKHTDMPATLVEVAFISNESEEKMLDSEEGIRKAAQGIADGIADYFG